MKSLLRIYVKRNKGRMLTKQQVESFLAMREEFGIARDGIPSITDEVEE